ncbi:Membrane-associated protein [bacterium HR33]|nr:Membrane-associated protein [bacterium HR33]
MQSHSLKLVTIITEAVIEKELIQELTGLGVSGYTITDARGKGHRGVRTTGWEHGANIRVEVVCDETLARAIADRLKERYYQNYAMILFVSDVEVLRPEKFKGERGDEG